MVKEGGNPQYLQTWKKGQSGNPAGRPKGSPDLSTRIRRMLDDPNFTTEMIGKDGSRVTFKGNPAEAIIKTAILKSMSGDQKWAEWLAKHGYGNKQILEIQNNPVHELLAKYGLDKIEDKPKKQIDDIQEAEVVGETE